MLRIRQAKLNISQSDLWNSQLSPIQKINADRINALIPANLFTSDDVFSKMMRQLCFVQTDCFFSFF